ncbi:polyketide biosynthesis malonyl-ACP decarboxylase PksF [Glycomyces halotolerans]
MTPVAITGIGVRTAIGPDRETFERALLSGRTAFARSGPHWTTAPLDASCPVPPGLETAARALARATPAAAIACAVAMEAWTHARLHTAPLDPGRIGIVLSGHNLADAYLDRSRSLYDRNPRYQDTRFALRRYDTDHIGTVSELLGVTGVGHTVGAASASGNLAIIAAAGLIATGAADACLVLAPPAELTDRELHGYRNIGALAAAEPCRPFDTDTAGFTPGPAAAALVLESRRSAAERAATVLAHLAGHLAGLDATSGPEPHPGNAADTMRRAIDHAGLTPADIAYVNAHGTGSARGDASELAAVASLWPDPHHAPLVNATKALTGHGLTAAGVVEAAATALQLAAATAHGNPRLRKPARDDVRLPADAEPLPEAAWALSNGFGFGGFRSSLVIGHPAATGADR